MGSFSWMRAEHTIERSNLSEGDRYKILVPIEFGGGYIADTYYDYGYVFHDQSNRRYYVDATGKKYQCTEFPINDLYGILAWWNKNKNLSYEGNTKPTNMYEILKYGETHTNRHDGIAIGCYDNEVDSLKYPLKLVSFSYTGTYEECKGKSFSDPNQGFGKYSWKNNRDELEKLIKVEIFGSLNNMQEKIALAMQSKLEDVI